MLNAAFERVASVVISLLYDRAFWARSPWRFKTISVFKLLAMGISLLLF
ncbi:Uncharacterised protein [Vibrio cholerae]|nr:Uncharacterised protein [Vibrio cholerae]CSD41216.1 Uncharacterised protein [Vibrio cholerae]CSI39848.1 Uncharacterised protein [Vibrio cholerae]